MADIIPLYEKLRYVVSNTGLTDQDFAASVHIDRSQFGRILRGNLNITLKQLLEISSLYRVRCGWLLENELPIYKNEKSGSLEKPDLQTQIKRQIDELRVNFDTFVESLPAHASENHERERVFEKLTGDKPQKAGKR